MVTVHPRRKKRTVAHPLKVVSLGTKSVYASQITQRTFRGLPLTTTRLERPETVPI